MREYKIDALNIKNPIYNAPINMGGRNNKDEKIEIKNYYLEKNGKPFYAICGEAHFSRMNSELWEDEILKMKMGGINIVATYIFWIHHEEIRGEYDWNENKNLRRFIEICKKHEMYVILRIGPFVHGECRNGGFPDWLFGCPFDIRCNDNEYLELTKEFYSQIYSQAKGLLYKDGGPVIGVQIENEHEHASCPWEMTTENSKEWVVPGRDGVNHMYSLKRLAIEVGFDVPLYTATAWGGACAPIETVFPLWGGYAFRPWMFYDENLKEHPATAEYLYGDFHNNEAPNYYNFDPEYPAEDFPYACCEMGGGMNVYYPYRFQLPYESVGALAHVKVGSGCNFLGYYMYHGGTHPHGKRTPYLNECAVPKFSYDYQAPIGEFGQVRDSFHFLKLQHLFYSEFTKEFISTKTVLSEESKSQQPEDVDTLRYVVRVDEEGKGFLFINNYQDHVDMKRQESFAISVNTDMGEVRVPSRGTLAMEVGVNAILPIWFRVGNTILRYATAQLITRINRKDEEILFFVQVPGMETRFEFLHAQIEECENCKFVEDEIRMIDVERGSSFKVVDGEKVYRIYTLTPNDAMRLWQLDIHGKREIVLSDVPVYMKNGIIECEGVSNTDMNLEVFRGVGKKNDDSLQKLRLGFEKISIETSKTDLQMKIVDCSSKNSEADGVLKRPVVGSPISSTEIVNARKRISISDTSFVGLKQLLIQIDYEGDIGYAYINGQMIHDNFCNGATWEFDLMPYRDEIVRYGLYIYISPKKQGAYVDNSSSMAARFEVVEEQVARISEIRLKGIEQLKIDNIV